MVPPFQPLAHFHAIPRPMQAAIFMVGAALLFAALSATIRFLSGDLHTFEVTFFRNFAGLLFMLPWLFRSGFSGLRTGRLALYTWRSFLSLVSMLCGFTSLTLLPFDKAIALSFTVPLFATAGAALFLGEDVRARRWTATIIGFIGVLIILHPGFGEASLLSGGGRAALGVGLSLFSALISAVITLIVKDLARTEPSDAIVTYMVLLLTPMSLIPAIPYWEWPPLELWLWIVIMGAFGSFGHMCFIRAFANADASAVMPYDYTRMIFAAIIGYFAFDEAPDIWTWVGAIVIAGAAIYIARRETIRRQSAATTAAAAAGEPAAPATIVRPDGKLP
ncbi:MAG TPA: DMT family transporter [Dongiaceae bacterium]|jgi:drug/metabolite transporter (DMT)-like permease